MSYKIVSIAHDFQRRLLKYHMRHSETERIIHKDGMKSIDLIKPYFLENRISILFGLACLIIVDILQLFIPRIIKWAVDDLTMMRIDESGLLKYALLILGVGLLIGLFRYLWRRCLLGMARRTEEGLRNRLFIHIQTLSASYFDTAKTGDLMAHATNDIQQIRMASGMGMVALNDAVVLGSASIGFMIYINLELTLYVLIPMPFIVLGTRFFSRKMHKRYGSVQAAFSDITEAVRERFAGIRVIKAANAQNNEAEKIDAVSRKYIKENLGLTRVTGAFFPLMLLLTNFSLAIVLFLGGRKAVLMQITPGDFVAFISYLGLLTWPMMALGWVSNLIQRGRASLDRLYTIFNVKPAIADKPNAVPFKEFKTKIDFNHVGFSYEKDRGKVLGNIDFSLEKGKMLGIIGPPGSGKTTLVELMMRLYDATNGTIVLDSIPIKDIIVSDLRSLMSVAPQEPFLFAGTVKDNITFGNPDVDEKKLESVTRLACLHDTVTHLPDGYDTIVGEKGVILSGGQKQRVALARAFLNDAPIMVLDDPISQVDTRTGAIITDTLRSFSGQKTQIIVSHRLSAVRHCHWILVFDKGEISESGTHDELMAANRYYAKTYRLQELEDAL